MRYVGAVLITVAAMGVSACSTPTIASGSRSADAPTTVSATPAPRESGASAPATPSPSDTGYAALLSGTDITTAEICGAFKKRIATVSAAAARRIEGGTGKARDPYVAADYRRSHPWVKEDLTTAFEASMTDLATSALNQVTNGRAGLAGDIDDYLDDALDVCGLMGAWEKALAVVEESVALGARIRSAANDKPWYPRGFEAYDGTLATRWIDNAGVDCFSRCWYWTLEVISQDGCPSGVYAELSLERGGTAVDWTNDSLASLRPGQKGRMQFITYADGAYGATGRLSELTCY